MRTPRLLFALMVLCLLTACGGGNKPTDNPNENPIAESEPEAEPEEPQEVTAVCIWNGVGVRQDADPKSKWLTSLGKGEKVAYLNESTTINDGKADREYYKIKLTDGTVGWARKDFVVADGKPVVVTKESSIYKRPDLLTKSDKMFKPMDIIAVKGENGDFYEVIGQRGDGKWIDKGYIKQSNLSYSDVDIAVAKFYHNAMSKESDIEQLEALSEILNNNDLSGSAFDEIIQEKALSLQ